MMTIIKETEREVVIVAGIKVVDNVAVATKISDIDLMELSKKAVELVIPEGVEEIKTCAFNNCRITSVKLPKSLKKIGDDAFANNRLTEISLPDKLEEIGWGAFRNNNLAEIELNDDLKIVGDGAFKDNNIEEVEVNKELKIIESGAFKNNPLKKVTLEGQLLEIGSGAFATVESNFSIKLPVNLKKIGRGAFLGNTTSHLELSEGTVERIGLKKLSKVFTKNWKTTTEIDVTTYKDFELSSKAFAYRGGLISIEAKLEDNVLAIKNKEGNWKEFNLKDEKEVNNLILTDIFNFTDCEDTYEEIHYTYKKAEESFRYQSDFSYKNGKIEGWLEHIDLIDGLTERTISHLPTETSRKTMEMFIERIR